MSSTVSIITGKNKYERLLEYSRFAQAAYGIGNSTPLSVAGAVATDVVDFKSTKGSGFNGALYKEVDPQTGTPRYVMALAGTVDIPDGFITEFIDANVAVTDEETGATELFAGALASLQGTAGHTHASADMQLIVHDEQAGLRRIPHQLLTQSVLTQFTTCDGSDRPSWPAGSSPSTPRDADNSSGTPSRVCRL